MPRYLDLFAGAGGLSEGFIRAGYEPVAHVEMDVAACYSLKTRVAYHWLKRNEKLNTYNRYLKGEITRNEFYEEIPKSVLDSVLNYEISEETLPVIFAEIDAMLGEKKLDLIVGGPPCQAYSLAGRSRSENKMVGDKRNYLYKLYAEFLKRYQPEYFVFENVVGLLSAKDEDGSLHLENMRKLFKAYGYSTEFRTLNASDYGVLQNRKRIILIGKRGEHEGFYPEIPMIANTYKAGELFCDLPSIKAGEGVVTPVATNPYSGKYLYNSGIKEYDQEPVTFHQARPHTEQDLEIYRIVVETWNKKNFPLFQRTNTRKKLSTNKQYVEAKKEAAEKIVRMSADQRYLKLLADHKTHMENSIVNMTSIINTKQMINSCKLCGQNIKDALLVGQADYEGNVKNIGAGQLGGIPAIVLASDLYAISAMAQNGHPIQSIIIDGSNANALMSQLPALDELIRLGVPITCVTDVVNSFDLQPFQERGFNLWRWDETSLTEKLYDAAPLSLDKKTKHCAKRKVNYVVTDGNEISTAIRLLYAHRKESQTASAQMLKLFDTLFSFAFTALRETVPFASSQCIQMQSVLDECSRLLAGEIAFLPEKTYDDYSAIISCLKKVFTHGYQLPKHEAFASQLRSGHSRRIALVVPERTDKHRVQQYWENWCAANSVATGIEVLYPAEYYLIPCGKCDATVVVGWLKRAIMRKALYSFNTQFYTVLLYDYEKRWKNYDTVMLNPQVLRRSPRLYANAHSTLLWSV